MEIHIIYLPLVFFLGMTYEHWRRRRFIKRRVATIAGVLRERAAKRDEFPEAGEQDRPRSQS
jgi:hypothetical protein